MATWSLVSWEAEEKPANGMRKCDQKRDQRGEWGIVGAEEESVSKRK